MTKALWLVILLPFMNLRADSENLPSRYDELLDFVQPAPQQGKTGTCLFVASTGAMELIANFRAGIKKPKPYGRYDLSESFIIRAPNLRENKKKSFWEKPVLRFNHGFGIHVDHWPFEGWRDREVNDDVWSWRDINDFPKIDLPRIETKLLFDIGNKWATYVLEQLHIDLIKKALVKYRSPVLVNYNHDGFWHSILILGYDDELPGACLFTSEDECEETEGSFYVRDSAEGMPITVRDYDWFRINGNAAVLIKEAL